MKDFKYGLKKGIPIALGYFPVAFSFGVLCINSGMPLGLATVISITNLTSSGQFAGVKLMQAQASYFEISLTVLMINARYFLMSLSLSQKIDSQMSTFKRLLISYGITDEIFTMASLEERTLTFSFMAGLILLPVIGWSGGALCGELVMGLLPKNVQGAMGIALYAMFLALVIPASRKSRSVLCVCLMAVTIHCVLTYLPLFSAISSGFKLIVAILSGAVFGALLFPAESEETS